MNRRQLLLSLGSRTLVCFSLAVLLLALSGCTQNKHIGTKKSPSGQPDWVLSTPLEEGFLYGVGSAEVFAGNQAAAVERAKDIARTELIKQIEVTVSSTLEQEVTETSINNSSHLEERLRQHVKSQVPDFKLTHVKQIDVHQSNRWISVLVRLNVTQEVATLKQRIANIDTEILRYGTQLTQLPRKGISTIRQIAPALVLADERTELQTRHNALKPRDALKTNASDDIRRVLQKIRKHIAELNILVTAKHHTNRALQNTLIQQLTENGMRVSSKAENADATITYDVDTNLLERDDTQFALTSGRIEIEDETGKTISAFQAKAKGVSVDVQEARSRSINKLAKQLADELMKALF